MDDIHIGFRSLRAGALGASWQSRVMTRWYHRRRQWKRKRKRKRKKEKEKRNGRGEKKKVCRFVNTCDCGVNARMTVLFPNA